MNILKKIKELNFPSDQYVIIGSGILDVLGIREAQDIDIDVAKELFNKLKDSGDWEQYEKYGRTFLKKDVFEINDQLNWENYDTTTEEAISNALMIEGIPFMNLDQLINFKTAMGREKDFKDIELINQYLDNK